MQQKAISELRWKIAPGSRQAPRPPANSTPPPQALASSAKLTALCVAACRRQAQGRERQHAELRALQAVQVEVVNLRLLACSSVLKERSAGSGERKAGKYQGSALSGYLTV